MPSLLIVDDEPDNPLCPAAGMAGAGGVVRGRGSRPPGKKPWTATAAENRRDRVSIPDARLLRASTRAILADHPTRRSALPAFRDPAMNEPPALNSGVPCPRRPGPALLNCAPCIT